MPAGAPLAAAGGEVPPPAPPIPGAPVIGEAGVVPPPAPPAPAPPAGGLGGAVPRPPQVLRVFRPVVRGVW
ncbi:hypothetical protein [Mycolicibacterium gilvum]|uniref:hypothetical protein n=1 Tax=Mycolicibacterium gilvum TaxID=1804 RepID=UPI001F3D6B73|nr:hypothetical protein [Mycolicibacterium gilvum]